GARGQRGRAGRGSRGEGIGTDVQQGVRNGATRPRRRREDREARRRQDGEGREGSRGQDGRRRQTGRREGRREDRARRAQSEGAREEKRIGLSPAFRFRGGMSVEDRAALVLRGAEETVTRDELRALLDRGGTPRSYVGLEPSGLMHIGTAFVIGSKVSDLARAGFHAIVLLADWHAYINDKLGSNLENLRVCSEYFKDAFRAVGVPDSVEYLYANEFVRHPEYWQGVIRVSKAASVARIRRALTIMGRKEEDADLDASKLIYPAMQVADIHWMDLDLALGGMDQRHAHMLYRDVAPKLGWKQVVALHTPLLPALDGGGRMDLVAGKMSKSRPDTSILLNDGPREVERKIGKAFCPAKEPVGNPVLEIARLILIPRRGKLMIPRDPKFGGDVVYESFNELAKSYANGELHPKDLKAGVAAGLNGELAPVRKYFEAHPENLAAVQRITRAG